MNHNFFFQTGGRSFYLPFLVVILSLFGCSKDKDTIFSQHNLSFDANGKNYSARTSAGFSHVLNLRYLECYAYFMPTENILEGIFNLIISNEGPMQEGTYQVDNDCEVGVGFCAHATFFTDPELTNVSSGDGGSLTLSISKADLREGGRITGTFSGTLVDGEGGLVNITNGEFDLPIE